MDRRLNQAWWLFRVGLGLGAFLAGLDKFFNLLTDWGMYVSPLAERLLPVSTPAFMTMVGVIEMAVGLVVLAGFTRSGGYVVMAWLLLIAANLVSTGMFFDLAVRDVEIAIGAYVLARLTEVRQEAESGARRAFARHAVSQTTHTQGGSGMSMKGITWAVAVVLTAAVAGSASAAERTWTNVPVVDTLCITKVKDNPDAHTRQCAIQCSRGGYGIIAQDGAYLKFDEKGNAIVIAALKASEKKDHLRATVVGEQDEDRIVVRSFTLD